MNFSPILQQHLSAQLNTILNELGLSLSEISQDKIIRYLDLLVLWNKSYNLTGIRDPEDMMTKHIADSLVIAPYITAQRIIDIGSGAGLPGIPLSLVFPDKHWTLLDSNGKKIRFLLQAKAELQLNNIEVVSSRIEEYQPKECYDGLVCRAWTKLNTMLEQTQHLCCSGAYLWAMKGKYPDKELSEITQNYQVDALKVPGLADQRHLVSILINNR